MKTLLIIQARMSSSRLPGKVLKEISGKSMLQRIFERCAQAKLVDHVVLATSRDVSDDPVARHAGEFGIPVYRGSLDDVLERFHEVAQVFRPEKIVRITGDCPLVDPELIDRSIEKFDEGIWDMAGNVYPPTFPDGLDVEVFSFDVLERAACSALKDSEREHVTLWMEDPVNGLRKGNLSCDEEVSSHCWTVDGAADLEFVRKVYTHFGDRNFGWRDVLRLITDDAKYNNESNTKRNEVEQDYIKGDLAGEGRGQRLYKRAKQVIPGGTQLLSKRPEMFLPDYWPAYFSRVSGCDVWDLDGKRYQDFSHNGIGTCILGAGDPDIDDAVRDAIANGTMSTLNCPEEVELAELLCELHPWASMARFCRTGGEAMALAVRIARAGTKRDKIAFCGYHGWHDWYLSANLSENSALDGHLMPGLMSKGVPRGLLGSTLPFRYNHLEDLQEIIHDHSSDIAAIVMEPIRGEQPDVGFLEGVRELATQCGARLVFDECSSGFRICCGGAHLTMGIEPDIAMFAKAMSNGYPMATVIGSGDAMRVAEETFMSSTYWTERIGPVAALACIKKFRREKVHEQLVSNGARVQKGWKTAGGKVQLPVAVGGIEPLSHFAIEHPQSNVARTYFTQRMLELGYLASGDYYATLAHTADGIDAYLDAVSKVFGEIVEAFAAGKMEDCLKGPPAHQSFKRLVR